MSFSLHYLLYQPHADIQKNYAHKKLECSRVGQKTHPDVIPCQDSRQGTDGDGEGQGPDHSVFPDIAKNAARGTDNVVQQIGGAYRRCCETQDTHLKRQDQEGTGDAGH